MLAQLGCQSPRVAKAPGCVWNEAEDCADLAASYGLTPDPWQRAVLEAWMGRDGSDRWTAGRWGIAVPRQNGKNGILEMLELFFMTILGLRILHTAHEVKTARKAFLRILSFFENERMYPELAGMVKELRKTNGQEAVVLHALDCAGGASCGCKGGGSVEFIARSKSSGRGFTVDVLVCDEAQEYGDDAQAALLPTISSAPSGDPIQILLGTPPAPGMDGSVFTRLREAGNNGEDRVAWCEWGVKPGDNRPFLEQAYETNPSLGGRLNLTTVHDEFGSMSPEMFRRERLGEWPEGMFGARAFKMPVWNERKADPPADGTVVFGVKFSADGSHVGLAAAVRPAEGPVHVEAIEQRPMGDGTQWLVDFLVDRKDRTAQVVVDGRSGVGFLVEALRTEGVGSKVILTPTLDQVITAHTMTNQGITEGGLTHSGQPELDKQVKDTGRRKIGTSGAFGWEALSPDGSVSLVDAMTLAFWGARTTKRKPGRRQRFI